MSKTPQHAGFLVWCPTYGPPTVSHATFAKAEAERERLSGVFPDRQFYVMAPVTTEKAKKAAQAFDDGKAEGYAEARREVVHAEARTDRLRDENYRLTRLQAPVRNIIANVAELQASAADCILWFDGFNAAHSHKDSWERPHTPARDKLQNLNGALQELMQATSAAADLDAEIPF